MKNILKVIVLAAASILAAQADAARTNQRQSKGRGAKQIKVKPLPHEPVAAGFVDWRGFETALQTNPTVNHPSDLRGRFVIVVTVEADKAVAQFGKCMKIQSLGVNPPSHTGSWADMPAHHDVAVVFNIKGGGPEHAEKLWKDEEIGRMKPNYAFNVFSGLGFEGEPDSGASYPFVYVMPPEGTEPLCKVSVASSKDFSGEIKKAIAAARKNLKPWRDWYGYLDEVKHAKKAESVIESGKPFGPVMMQLKKDIQSKKPEVARESQIIYDAIMQKRNDLIFRMQREYRSEPFVAMHDYEQFVRRWPADKKLMAKMNEDLDSVPELKQGYAVYETFKKYSNPEYIPATASEASKAVNELKRIKPTVDKLTASKMMSVQNMAFTIQQALDGLIEEIPTRVQPK